MTPRKILLYGGSFNPPHLRHVSLAQQAAKAIGASEIRVIPTNINPQRQNEPPASAPHRVAMLAIAFRNEPLASIDTAEIDRGGPSFMVDTLNQFRRQFPDAQLFLLLGGDQVLNFYTWREPETILSLAMPVIVPRAPHDAASLVRQLSTQHGEAVANRWKPWILPLEAEPDSSTELRQGIAAGKSASELDIDPEVLNYIQKHKLYR
ncbi:MAG: nicotinate (nicotinamide) nucleotide adenylyltransferase [Planctomycetes bacterium]|nr:nicotinate (nicotinamide) nucleotide adenylyltransferase [Planctomycetota bacterium]